MPSWGNRREKIHETLDCRPADPGRRDLCHSRRQGRCLRGHPEEGHGAHRHPARRAAVRLAERAARARRLRHRARRHGRQGAGREARDAAGDRRQPHSLPDHQQGRHRDLGDGAHPRARQAGHVHRALCRHPARGVRAQERQGGVSQRHRQPQGRRRQGHDRGARAHGHGAQSHHHAHRG